MNIYRDVTSVDRLSSYIRDNFSGFDVSARYKYRNSSWHNGHITFKEKINTLLERYEVIFKNDKEKYVIIFENVGIGFVIAEITEEVIIL